ncbi:MAG: LysR family [Verrucomicrobia bacterium]|nr:MAG: LysR family [Verrucomicrobiota bacterium]
MVIDFINSRGMNVHHLELFYYVAKHGGLSAAARGIPYGIQQPAISSQVLRLEQSLGRKLFERKPFRLTSEGQTLYEFIAPFFGALEITASKIRGNTERVLRIGAPEAIHGDYLPRILKDLGKKIPGFRFNLLSAGLDEIEAALDAGEIDLGVAPLVHKKSGGTECLVLLDLHMGLLVPKASPLRKVEELWKSNLLSFPLITTGGRVPRLFLEALKSRNIDWLPSLELESQLLVSSYVREGFGVGLILVEAQGKVPAGTRLFRLADFPGVPYGILWRGALSALQEAFIEEAQKAVRDLGVGF